MIAPMFVSTASFHNARDKAKFARLLDFVRNIPNSMFPFDVVRDGIRIRSQRTLGLQAVPLTHIIGSEGRYRDFDRRFLPQTDRVKERWLRVEQAMARGMSLPPIEVYKMSEVYFVRDGNHRVSVARHLGWFDIQAMVTELLVDVELTPALSAHTLLLKQERSDFLEWTNLHALRPDERVECDEPGGYLHLIQQINAHRRAMTVAQQCEITCDEAVADWYDTVYVLNAC
jgi:hypothetical protein